MKRPPLPASPRRRSFFRRLVSWLDADAVIEEEYENDYVNPGSR